MLVSFECTVVGQRLRNLSDVRRLQAPKQVRGTPGRAGGGRRQACRRRAAPACTGRGTCCVAAARSALAPGVLPCDSPPTPQPTRLRPCTHPPPSQPLNVYRQGRWGKLAGDALLPGDVVSVVRPGECGAPAHAGRCCPLQARTWSLPLLADRPVPDGHVARSHTAAAQRAAIRAWCRRPTRVRGLSSCPASPPRLRSLHPLEQRAARTWCCRPTCCCWRAPPSWMRRCSRVRPRFVGGVVGLPAPNQPSPVGRPGRAGPAEPLCSSLQRTHNAGPGAALSGVLAHGPQAGPTPALAVPSPGAGESTPQWKNPVGEATGDEVDASELEPTSRWAAV